MAELHGTISPISNASGTANITFTISDGTLTASRVFAFTATAVNDAPLISDVVNQSPKEDSVLNGLGVTISDGDSSLVCGSVLSGASGNTRLLPMPTSPSKMLNIYGSQAVRKKSRWEVLSLRLSKFTGQI